MQNYPFYHSNFPRDGVGIQQTPLSNQSPQKRRTVFNGLKARPLSRPDARRQQRCDSTKLNSNLGASLPKNSSKPPSHPLGGQAVNFPPIRFFKYQPTNHIFFAHRWQLIVPVQWPISSSSSYCSKYLSSAPYQDRMQSTLMYSTMEPKLMARRTRPNRSSELGRRRADHLPRRPPSTFQLGVF